MEKAFLNRPQRFCCSLGLCFFRGRNLPIQPRTLSFGFRGQGSATMAFRALCGAFTEERTQRFGHLFVVDQFGAAGTRPYLDMMDRRAPLSGGFPALITAATSLKYWAPMSGDCTTKARTVSVNGFEKA